MAARYREAHPLVFVITHWVDLISIAGLAVTGIYIHYPFWAWTMSAARSLHTLLMYILLISLGARVILAFWVRDAILPDTRVKDVDWRNWLPQRENRGTLMRSLKYALFLSDEPVVGAKYGTLQKAAYMAVIPLVLAMAYTGLALYGPARHWRMWPMLDAGILAVGGLPVMRTIHYLGMWLLLAFAAAHAYMVNLHGLAPTKLMLGWIETPAKEAE